MGIDDYIIKQYDKMLMTEFRWWAYGVHYKILSIFCIFIIFHNKIWGLGEACFIWFTIQFLINFSHTPYQILNLTLGELPGVERKHFVLERVFPFTWRWSPNQTHPWTKYVTPTPISHLKNNRYFVLKHRKKFLKTTQYLC